MITRKIAEYQTKYEEGFTQSEIDSLTKELELDYKKLNSYLENITALLKNDEVVIYKHDLAKAIKYLKK